MIDQAKRLGYQPEDPFEWLTYIRAQALTENLDAAEKLSHHVFQQDNSIRKGLCEVWKRVQVESTAETRVNQILSDFQCAR